MNTPSLLQPHLLETNVLRDHLKMVRQDNTSTITYRVININSNIFQRCLPIPNIDQLSRPELLRIFGSFAVPMHKRTNNKTKASTTTNVPTPISAKQFGSKRKHDRIVIDNLSNDTKGIEANFKQCTISRDYTTMEEVTRDCKQIKLVPDEKQLKRPFDQMVTFYENMYIEYGN